MRVRYFAGWLLDRLRQEEDLPLSMRTFEEVGYTSKPVGLVAEYSDGSRFYVQLVGASPDGGDASRPDKPEAYPTGTDAVLTNSAGSPLSKSALEDFLVGVVEKAQHPDVLKITRYESRYGFRLDFEDGSAVYALWLGPARSGGDSPEGELYNHPRK